MSPNTLEGGMSDIDKFTKRQEDGQKDGRNMMKDKMAKEGKEKLQFRGF